MFINCIVSVGLVTASLDAELRLVAEACSSGLGHATTGSMGFLATTREHVLKMSPASSVDSEKRQHLLEIIAKVEGLLQSRVSKEQSYYDDFLKTHLQTNALYSLKIAHAWVAYVNDHGSAEDKLMGEMFTTTASLDRWRRRVYRLPVEDGDAVNERFSVLDRLLGYPGLSDEKEAAIASISVWLLQVSTDEKLSVRLAALVSKHAQVFLRQRQALGIPFHSEKENFSFAEFVRADKMSYEIFRKVYDDNEVGQLVRTMSGMVAFAENQDNLDEATFEAYDE